MFNRHPRKYILANGCSFTADDFQSRIEEYNPCDWPKWPHLLGSKLGVEVLNLADCGKDNQTIIDETIDQIFIDKPWMVVIGLTEIPRFRLYGTRTFQTIPGWNMTHTGLFDQMKGDNTHNRLINPWIEWFWLKTNNLSIDDNFFIQMCTDHYKRIIRLQTLCDKLSIKLIMTHLLPMVSHDIYFKDVSHRHNLAMATSRHDMIKALAKAPGFFDVDKSSIIGWPHMLDWNEGFYITDVNRHNDPLCWIDDQHTVGVGDSHPNKRGQEIIAEYFYEHYQKTFT